MSRETISLADQVTIKACQALTTDQTLTVPSLLNLLGRVPGLVQSLAARLEVQYDKTETLCMQVKDLQGNLAQWDAERRGIAVMRDKFGARPEENDAEFIARIHQERIDAQAEVLRLSSDLALMTERAQKCSPERILLDEVAKLEGLLNKETTENARLVAELTEAEIKIGEQAQVERTVNAALRRVDALEAKIQNHTGHSGLSVSDLVHEAYQTAKDKGWHDPADENDVTVVEARQALCREGLRALHLCRIAEMLRKGRTPLTRDYLPMFSEDEHRLTATEVRFISDLMLVITEVGEAIEDVIGGRLEERVDEKGKPIGLPSELADVVIRVAHICGHRKIDLTGAVQRKLAFNKTRPHKHGKRA